MDESKLVQVWQDWKLFPVKFVVQAIGAVPTNQQADALRELGLIYDAKMRRSAGAVMTEAQKTRSNKLGISIRSGHGTGKDAFLAWVYLWLLTCFPGARGLVTAPTQHQLQDVLWSEMRKWCRRSAGNLHEYIEVQTEKAYRKDKSGKDDAFVVNRTARIGGSLEEQGETLAGMHGDYMILAVDEASGVADGVFKPLEGAMTGKFNMAIMIANPTRNHGYFFNSHASQDRKYWLCKQWSCEDSDMDTAMGNNAMGTYVERTAEKYGKESNFYRMRVLGDFPTAEPDSLIPLDWIMAAVERFVIEVPGQGAVMGVDVAWVGDDESVICVRRGMVVEPMIVYKNLDLQDLAGRIAYAISEVSPSATVIDKIGIGAGVFTQLRDLRRGVHGINVSESAQDKEKFVRLRDELWWRLRERFEAGLICLPRDDDLVGELSSIKYKREPSGKIKVESKDDMRKRGVGSPNRGDALMMTEFYRDSVFRPRGIDRYIEEPEPRRGGWMSS